MDKIKGILFDKDGTIIDFNSTWIPAAKLLVEMLLEEFADRQENNLRDELTYSIGIIDGKVVPDSIYASGTMSDVADEFYRVLSSKGMDCGKVVDFRGHVASLTDGIMEKGTIQPVPAGKLADIFSVVKDRGLYIGLATADTLASTKSCLEKLGVEDYFDFIGCDNGIYKSKPHPEMLLEFCRLCGITPEEVAVVGDTLTDMEFARQGKAGLAVGILAGSGNQDRIRENADIVCNTIQEIISDEGMFIWENIR